MRKDRPKEDKPVLQAKRQPTANTDAPKVDLRPAVFIKDLKKRSIALEEEKADHFSKRNQAGAHKKVAQEQGPLTKQIISLKRAINSKDVKTLTEAVYTAKMELLETESEQSMQVVQSLISKAEECLLQAATAK